MKVIKVVAVVLLLLVSSLISYFLYNRIIKTAKDSEVKQADESYGLEEEQMKATLSLVTEQSRVTVGEEISVNIVLDAKIYDIPAADVMISFDPDFIEVTEVVDGEIFSAYPYKKIKQTDGRVIISAAADPDSLFSGQGVVATLKVRTKVAGITDLNFIFEDEDSTLNTYVATIGGESVSTDFSGLELTVVSEASMEQPVDSDVVRH